MAIARNLLAGVASGFGAVVLLQQYAVLYPTGTVAIIGVLVGVAVQFAVAAGFGPRRVAATVAVDPLDAHRSTDPTATPMATVPVVETGADAWIPSHRVPDDGLDTWPERDPALERGPRLDPGLGVRVDHVGEGWAHVVCENGWTAWVDAGRLEEWR